MKIKQPVLFFIVLFVFTSCGSATSAGSLTYETRTLTIQTSATNLSLTVEVADTDAKQAQGLMNRQSLGANNGMLFIFDSEGPRSFWMKNTFISLDIVFMNASKEIVYIEQNTTPLSEDPIAPSQSSQYILEVNGGYSAQNGVSVGDKVSW